MYNRFIEDFRSDIEYALFHVMNIFRDIDAMAWYARSVIKYVVDNHAPVKCKSVTSQSVSYMDSEGKQATEKLSCYNSQKLYA